MSRRVEFGWEGIRFWRQHQRCLVARVSAVFLVRASFTHLDARPSVAKINSREDGDREGWEDEDDTNNDDDDDDDDDDGTKQGESSQSAGRDWDS